MIRQAYNKGTTTLVLTDRIELCKQTLKAISQHNINPQILNANSDNFTPTAPVTIAMCETIKRRMKKWTPNYYSPKLIIIDEAHKASFNAILDAFPSASVIGATATPKAKHLHRYYTNIVQNIDIPELIEKEFLSPCRAYMMKDDFSKVQIRHGEFVEKQLFDHFNKAKLYSGVIKEYKEKCNNSKALVFNVNIEHAIKMCEEFNVAGISSKVIHSKTPSKERDIIIREFAEGKFKVLSNCGILTTGYDEETIETIIINRATMSEILWLQMQGRGSRIHPGKPYFTVLDFGMNHIRHDLWEMPRTWNLDPPKPKKKGIAPVKNCPKCSAMLAAAAKICKFCGYIFPEQKQELKNGVMVEVTPKEIPSDLKGKQISQLSIPELVRVCKSGAISKPFVWRVIRSKGEQAIEEFGWKNGYAPGWAFHQKKEIMNSNFKDVVL